MKILQLNIWLGRLLNQVEALIEKEQPDILCLQEVLDAEGTIYLPDQVFDSLKRIKKTSGLSYDFFSPTNSFQVAGVQGHFGNAILSRYPLKHVETIFTNNAHNTIAQESDHIPNIRNLQITQVDTPDGVVTVFNHHGHWEPNQFGSPTSVEKLQIVADQVRKQVGPIIVAGDFNVVAESDAMRVFDNLLVDLTAEHNITTTLSQFGKVSDVACDHILINDEISPLEFRVCEELVSDHKGLIMQFDI
jgi:endonuclease/exonuclease/phosphatase family metal-dependent hydrolase